MTDNKYPASGSIRYWWTPPNGFANPKAPTEAELAASLDLSDAISWNDKDYGVQASNTISDPAITAKGNVQTRGAAQYGGSLSFYYPREFNDDSNHYSVVFDALRLPGTRGFLTSRVDGLELAQAAGTAAHPGWDPEAGDLVTVSSVESAGYGENITGEEAFRYTISFLPKGEVNVFAVVRESATPVAPVVSGASTASVGDYVALEATLVGRKYTRGVIWRTSTPNLAHISPNGIVTALAAGTASFTAVDPATGTASTAKTITIS